MYECTLCGKEVLKIFKARVENSETEVCENCLKYGIKIEEISLVKKTPAPKKLKQEHVLKTQYGKLIANARTKKGLERKKFSKQINEKESVVRRIENQEIRPDNKLMKKIEKFLEIKLTELPKEKKLERKSKKIDLTIGDVVELE